MLQDVDETLQYKRRGGVWKYFKTNVDKQAAKCRKCLTLISYKGGSTTNLLRHMKSKHPTLKIPRKLNNDGSSAELQYAYAEIVSECVKSDAEDDANIGGGNGDRLTVKNDDITTSTIIRQSKSDVVDCGNPVFKRHSPNRHYSIMAISITYPFFLDRSTRTQKIRRFLEIFYNGERGSR